MGLYERRILPWLLDRAMRQQVLEPHRRRIVASAEGRVLEIEYRDIRREMRAPAEPLARSLPVLVERWITHNTRHARFIADLVKIKAQNLTKARVSDDAGA